MSGTLPTAQHLHVHFREEESPFTKGGRGTRASAVAEQWIKSKAAIVMEPEPVQSSEAVFFPLRP